jgi:putative ABC transport system permease protein
MRKARAWLRRLGGLFGWRRSESELAAELESHLALHIEDNLRAGMMPEEARRQALLKLGGLEQAKESYRERRGIPALETLWQDVRYGLRMLRKSPGFTLAAVLTLALGIGANTAIFSVVDAVLLRALPFKDAGRLVLLRETNARVGRVSVSYPDFLDWRKQARSFSSMAAVGNIEFDLTGAGQPEDIAGYRVSPNFLSLLGVTPILGRDFQPQEEKPDTAPVVLLGYRLWQTHFGGRGDVLGKPLQLDDKVYTIIGVLPAGFRFLPGDDCDLLAPIGIWAGDDELTDRGDRGDMSVVARLAPGATPARAQAEIQGIAARLAQAYPGTNAGMGASLRGIREVMVGNVQRAILVVFGAALLVLLVACVNVAGLYLVRAAARSREIAVRLAFGASRGRIIRQMLTESLLLAALGGGAGVVAGAWGLRGLLRLTPPDLFAGVNVRLDPEVFLFAGFAAVFAAIGFGLAPAFQAAGADVQETLKEAGRGGTAGARQHRLRNAFAVAQTALALMLLVCAGLMVQSLYRLTQVDPGFRPEHLLDMEMNLRVGAYAKPGAQLQFWRQVLEQVRALPGVERAAIGTAIPFTDDHSRSNIRIEGAPAPKPGQFPHPDFHFVSPGYFSTMGIRLVSGRTFSESDNAQGSPVAMINQTLARRYWRNGDAVGKRFAMGARGPAKNWITIIGVVGDTRLYGLDQPARFEVYLPMLQWPSHDMHLEVRSAIDPASLTGAIRGAVAAVDPDVPVYGIQTLKQAVGDSISARRLTLALLGLFSLLALALAAIGVYGVISYATAQRTQEIGVRMTLGAAPANVARMVVGHGARLAAIGVVAGLAGAAGLARLLGTLLYGVSAADPMTFAAAAAVLALVALGASWVPARRAARVDPMVSLRHE